MTVQIPPPDTPWWDESIERMPRDALAGLQAERLRWQVRRCYELSPFYRERLDGAGVSSESIRFPDDIARIPVVTKDQLRDEQAQHSPLGRFTVAERSTWREMHPSTGTTGSPVNTIWSAADVRIISDFTARTMWQFGVRPGDVVQNAFAYGLWVAGLSAHYAASLCGALCIPIGASASTQRQIDFLRNPGATVLLATPSYGMHIAEALREREIDVDELPLRLGCFGGEAGTENPPTRGKLEAGLGIKAFDYYGLAEVGPTFASECPEQAGIHFAEDHVLVECLDPGTQKPVPDGAVGVLVFTHLSREATPMLRYWSNDYAILTHDACTCGRTHVRALGGILGRHDDLVVFKGAKFYPVQVEKAVRSFGELSDEFRIELRRVAAGSSQVAECVVVAEWGPQGPVLGAEERIRRALREELGVTPGLRLEAFGTLERTTFKAKRIIEQ